MPGVVPHGVDGMWIVDPDAPTDVGEDVGG
jgi:hypothetical protein